MKLCYGNFKNKLDKAATLALLKENKKGLSKDVFAGVCFAVQPDFFAESQKTGVLVMQQNIQMPQIDESVRGKMFLIGHSDYRINEKESSEFVNIKLAELINFGAKVVLCCGDTLEIKQSGKSCEYVREQLNGAVGFDSQNLIIAYEPVYAIGGTVAADIKDVMPVINEIKGMFKHAKVLYGGSVNADNAAQFLKEPQIDGVLVGGASLKFESFNAVVKIAGQFDSAVNGGSVNGKFMRRH